jgi:hypothetical protein
VNSPEGRRKGSNNKFKTLCGLPAVCATIVTLKSDPMTLSTKAELRAGMILGLIPDRETL